MAKTTKSTRKTKKSETKTASAKTAAAKATRPAARGKVSTVSLKRLNLVAAVLHAAQGVAILFISKGINLPVTTNYSAYDSLAASTAGHAVYTAATRRLFDASLPWLIAIMFFAVALTHLLLATVLRRRYEAELAANYQRVRWIEFGVGGGLILWLVALLLGLSDLTTFLMLMALSVIGGLVCLEIEEKAQVEPKPRRLSRAIGLIAILVPAVSVAIYTLGNVIFSDRSLPGYLWGLLAAVVAFALAASIITMRVMQRRGAWANYLFGERSYIVTGIIGKALVAWIIFYGVLR